MDKPKTIEESKFSEDDFKYYTDTIVRIMKNAICKKGSTPNDAIDELNSFFAQAISAERNANLEKIKELEVSLEGNLKALEMRNDKIKSLESKLATANAKIVELEDAKNVAESHMEHMKCVDKGRWKAYEELQANLSTANKKAEKIESELKLLKEKYGESI